MSEVLSKALVLMLNFITMGIYGEEQFLRRNKENRVDLEYFKSEIAPLLNNYQLAYSSHLNGDFGSLERVEIEGKNKLATIDIWSKDWLNIDIYDLLLDKQVMNVLLTPTVKILLNEK